MDSSLVKTEVDTELKAETNEMSETVKEGWQVHSMPSETFQTMNMPMLMQKSTEQAVPRHGESEKIELCLEQTDTFAITHKLSQGTTKPILLLTAEGPVAGYLIRVAANQRHVTQLKQRFYMPLDQEMICAWRYGDLHTLQQTEGEHIQCFAGAVLQNGAGFRRKSVKKRRHASVVCNCFIVGIRDRSVQVKLVRKGVQDFDTLCNYFVGEEYLHRRLLERIRTRQ